LTASARARIHALAAALPSGARNERLRFVNEFLARKGIPRESVETKLQENLRRLVAEQRAYQEKLRPRTKQTTKPQSYWRVEHYSGPGFVRRYFFAPELRAGRYAENNVEKGAIQPGTMHRVLVIGPGLDFTDKRDGYDFYPIQTIQPFAMVEAVARLGLGKAEEISVVTADLNAAVNAHVARLAERGRAGQAYTVQLPRLVSAEWSRKPWRTGRSLARCWARR